MQTLILDLVTQPVSLIAAKSAELLSRGGLVIFPTETVYGIGADPYNLEAVERIFQIKGRKRDNPLIFHISNLDMLSELAYVPKSVETVIEEFMPGPLTLVFKSKIERKYTFGLDTVAVRMPDNLIALEMIEKFGKPVVAPSANISGKPSGTDFLHVFEDFNGKVDLIINGGTTVFGIESTVIDVTGESFMLLRAGAVALEDLQEKGVFVYAPEKEHLLKRSPGTRYKHYAPNALVIPFETEEELILKMEVFKDKKSALIGIHTTSKEFAKKIIFNDVNEYARFLYSTFRYLDALKIEVIFAEMPDNRGIGLAVRDRIKRASEN
ncbi:MAG: L-threonylcarbamoyladenylate synthase [bacterium]